jgi:hypothetical protein
VEALLDEALALALPTQEAQRLGLVAAARAEAAWGRQDFLSVVSETNRGLEWTIPAKESWLTGELLFWKSLATPGGMSPVPEWVCEPYRLAVEGEWLAAAGGFARHELPYEQALVLAQGGEEDRVVALKLRTQLGIALQALPPKVQ